MGRVVLRRHHVFVENYPGDYHAISSGRGLQVSFRRPFMPSKLPVYKVLGHYVSEDRTRYLVSRTRAQTYTRDKRTTIVRRWHRYFLTSSYYLHFSKLGLLVRDCGNFFDNFLFIGSSSWDYSIFLRESPVIHMVSTRRSCENSFLRLFHRIRRTIKGSSRLQHRVHRYFRVQFLGYPCVLRLVYLVHRVDQRIIYHDSYSYVLLTRNSRYIRVTGVRGDCVFEVFQCFCKSAHVLSNRYHFDFHVQDRYY